MVAVLFLSTTRWLKVEISFIYLSTLNLHKFQTVRGFICHTTWIDFAHDSEEKNPERKEKYNIQIIFVVTYSARVS